MKAKAVFAGPFLIVCLAVQGAFASDLAELQNRQRRAMDLFSDGVLLLHAAPPIGFAADSYRENPAFYYLTGLENASNAILAIDGKNRETWLFIPTPREGRPAAILAGDAAAKSLGVQHVVDWTELDSFFARAARERQKLYYERGYSEIPSSVSEAADDLVPSWLLVLQKKHPTLKYEQVGTRINTLMAIESASEQADSRAAARATVAALFAGIKGIKPGASQRSIEIAVESECWRNGAHGVSFWPWVMSGPNAVFPKPFESLGRYDHLDSIMQRGDLVRLDVGCEWRHYQGDLGRTVPVDGHYTEEQREIWNLFVAAYQAGTKQLRVGTTDQQVFDAWKAELLSHRESVKSRLARQAIDSWTDRKNVPFWQLHTMNLDAGFIEGTLQVGMVLDFEPIASIGGQGYYLEDMFLITENGAEVLTPGVPYTAEEIERVMQQK